MSRVLRERGDESAVLSYNGCPEGADQYGKNGVGLAPGPKGVPPSQGRARCGLGPYPYDERLAECVRREARKYDVVVLVNAETLQYSPEAAGGGCVIANLADDPILEIRRRLWRDAHPVRWARHVKFMVGERLYEKTFIGPVGLATFVSEEDAGSFARRHPGKRAAFIPNGVDAEYFSRPLGQMGACGGAPTIMFLGNMGHVPNKDAALFLIQDVAPRVWRRIPEARFVIVGCNPHRTIRRLAGPRVEVTGFVRDTRPLLWAATVVMIPMRIGTGIKNKLLEAWASGAAVVATGRACQGIPAEEGRNLLLGNSAQELADAAVRVLEDDGLRKELGARGKATVEQRLTWETAARRLSRAVAAMKPRVGPARAAPAARYAEEWS